MSTPEQEARDLLERMGVEDAQSWTAGDVVELANLLADYRRMRDVLYEVEERADSLAAYAQTVLRHTKNLAQP